MKKTVFYTQKNIDSENRPLYSFVCSNCDKTFIVPQKEGNVTTIKNFKYCPGCGGKIEKFTGE